MMLPNYTNQKYSH